MFGLFQDLMAINRLCQHHNIYGTMIADLDKCGIQEVFLLGKTTTLRFDIVAQVIIRQFNK